MSSSIRPAVAVYSCMKPERTMTRFEWQHFCHVFPSTSHRQTKRLQASHEGTYEMPIEPYKAVYHPDL